MFMLWKFEVGRPKLEDPINLNSVSQTTDNRQQTTDNRQHLEGLVRRNYSEGGTTQIKSKPNFTKKQYNH